MSLDKQDMFPLWEQGVWKMRGGDLWTSFTDISAGGISVLTVK